MHAPNVARAGARASPSKHCLEELRGAQWKCLQPLAPRFEGIESPAEALAVLVRELLRIAKERGRTCRSEQRVIGWMLIVLLGVAGLLVAYLLAQANLGHRQDPVQAPAVIRRPAETENGRQLPGDQTESAPNGQPAEDASSRD